ncbi:MAG: glycosyltransferase family 8 protein [Sphaerochaeta sp.]|nr:glycosyltransferase family 8 protein [Sphaerochaeta sp.]
MPPVEIIVVGTAHDVFPPEQIFIPALQEQGIFVRYGIFSALHSNWKKGGSGHIGFCTSQEYLNFSSDGHPGNLSAMSEEPHLSKATLARYGLDDARVIAQAVTGFDLVVSSALDGKRASPSFSSVNERLRSIPGLRKRDLQDFLALIAKTHPQYETLANAYGKGSQFRQDSLFVMKRPLFEEYCTLLFGLFDLFLADRDMQGYAKEELVALEGLGNLVTQLFVMHTQGDASKKVVSMPTVRFKERGTPFCLKAVSQDAVPVVFASNEHFAPFLGVCIQSMLEHTSPSNLYDIVVLESNLSEDSKNRLLLMTSRKENVSLRFFNPTAMLSGRKLQKNTADHISMETYYRFLIGDILPEYSKALYLDCDTVILSDVAELFATDLGSCVLGAAPDPEIPGQRNDDPSLVTYLREVLLMEDSDPYLQAGVLVLNLEAMNKLHSVDQWIHLAGERRYRYNDQDILNKECKGRLHLLPLSWNTVVNCNNRRLPIIERGPHPMLEAYLEARKNPKLVHYAGFEKPWDAPFSDFAYLFWDVASRSTFSDRVLSMRVGRQDEKKRDLPIAQRFFPRGTRRRVMAKKMFYWISRT